ATSAANFVVVPKITAFSPASGAPGSSVTITGTTFTGATAVKFYGLAASFTVNSNTQITATVPANATSGSITVTTPGGTATCPSAGRPPPQRDGRHGAAGNHEGPAGQRRGGDLGRHLRREPDGGDRGEVQRHRGRVHRQLVGEDPRHRSRRRHIRHDQRDDP